MIRKGLVLWTLWACVAAAPVSVDELPKYETKYYVIQTDLDPAGVREAAVRVSRMAEVYHDRTRDFSGAIRKKFPFILFKRAEDYHAAGGPVGTAGVYDGRVLMAVAGERLGYKTWRVVQHEGFHQFAMNVIRGDLPVWVNEGLAEYFGEGIFTGDDLVTGVIPDWRMKRVKQSIAAGRFKPLDRIMQLSLDQWNRELAVENYDQAWSMVHFLVHGDDGKYRKAFVAFMGALGRGKGHNEAWRRAFGDGRGFENRWREYWTNLPENSTDDLYRRATVATLTSFLARAHAAGQTFDSMPAFEQAVSDDLLQCATEEQLPRGILIAAMNDVDKRVKNGEKFSILLPPDEKLPQITMEAPDGARLVGKFDLRNGRVNKVWVDIASRPIDRSGALASPARAAD